MASKLKDAKLSDYRPDPKNHNRHTPRGMSMLENAVTEVGLGRSVVADKNGIIVAGNGVVEAAGERGIQKVIEVETDGETLVVVKRTDLDLKADTDNRARRLAWYDNRVSMVNIQIDGQQLQEDLSAGVDLEKMFREDEIDLLLASADVEAMVTEALSQGMNGRINPERLTQVKPVLYVEDVALFERAIRATGKVNRGEALLDICRAYLAQVENNDAPEGQ